MSCKQTNTAKTYFFIKTILLHTLVIAQTPLAPSVCPMLDLIQPTFTQFDFAKYLPIASSSFLSASAIP